MWKVRIRKDGRWAKDADIIVMLAMVGAMVGLAYLIGPDNADRPRILAAGWAKISSPPAKPNPR